MSSEPHERAGERPEDDGGEAGTAGWIPPERRAWRHPSELGSATLSAPPPAGWLHRHRLGAAVALGTTGAAAAIVGLLLLLSVGASPPGTTALADMPIGTAAITQCCRLAASLARSDEAALVSLRAPDGARACAVAVGDGQLLVTTRAALGGARQVSVVAADGRRLVATLVAVDPGSGIALLRVNAPLVPVPVAQVPTLDTGSAAMAVTLRPPLAAKTARRAVWSSGTVVAIGATDPTIPAAVSDIAVRGASVPATDGALLVDGRGAVVGVQDGASGNVRTYLPIQLVENVATQLDTIGKVRHGWLDVVEATSATTMGAQVVSVAVHGASVHALRPGDVIVALDDSGVTSAPQLRTMLYTMAPGTRVSLAVRRGDRVITVAVQLSPSP